MSLFREPSETGPAVDEHTVHDDDHPFCPLSGHCRESPVEVVAIARPHGEKPHFQCPSSDLRFAQLRRTDVRLFPEHVTIPRAGNQTAKFVIRDKLRHRRDIEQAYLAAIRAAKREIVMANSYFFPGITFRRELVEAVERALALALVTSSSPRTRIAHSRYEIAWIT